MNNMKRVILLSLFLGAMALSLHAQERRKEPTFLPAVGIATVGDYTIAWESGAAAVGTIANDDKTVLLSAGLGSVINGYVDLPADTPNTPDTPDTPDLPDTPNAVEALALHTVKAYPNPAAESVELDLTTIRGTVDVDLFNALGVRVLHQTVAADASVRLSLSGLAGGLYIVRVTTPDGALLGVTRLTVQR